VAPQIDFRDASLEAGPGAELAPVAVFWGEKALRDPPQI